MTTTKNAEPKTKSAVDPIPAGMRTVTQHLICADAANVIAFYQKACGASAIRRVAATDICIRVATPGKAMAF